MRMMNIASGSNGNVTYIGTEENHILIDTGISMKRINEGLRNIDLDMSDIDAIFYTHEHSDHVAALGVISRKYDIPMYMTEGTLKGVRRRGSLGNVDRADFKIINNNDTIRIGDILVKSHPISHDANDPVCFTAESGNKKISIATDMGCYDQQLITFLSGCDAMLIETNHDINMLEVGPYDYQLKLRILGDKGHLSNDAGGLLIRELLNPHIRAIFLGHLSKENNFEDLAYETVKFKLSGNPYSKDVRDFGMKVAHRDRCSRLVEI